MKNIILAAFAALVLAAAPVRAGSQPQSYLDECYGKPLAVHVTGWAYDPDVSSLSIGVIIYLYSDSNCTRQYGAAQTRTANVPRLDVNRARGIEGEHGFDVDIPVPVGTYWVKVFAMDATKDGNVQVGTTRSVIVLPSLPGSGTDADPYRISSVADWDVFSAYISAGFGSDSRYRLVTDIGPVTNTVGTQEHPFRGTFDGTGRTLTASLSGTGYYVAPFSVIGGASISNLVVAGTVAGNIHCSGLVGRISGGTNMIENCEVAAAISSSGSHFGGFIGHSITYAATLRGCVFSGSLSGGTCVATFHGWSDGGAETTLIDCLDASASAQPIGRGADAVSVFNTYYLAAKNFNGERLWSEGKRGKRAYAVTAGADVTINFGLPREAYDGTTRIFAYSPGLASGGSFYAGQGDVLQLDLDASLPFDVAVYYYRASAGTLSQRGNPWTLTMPDGPVVVNVNTHGKVRLWANGPYWTEANVGANEPWESGYYFWWGDTVGYRRENNTWVAINKENNRSSSNFSFDHDNVPTCGKDNATLLNEGWITADGVLAPEHDAAQTHWGGSWRMPTKQELYDLSLCDWTLTTTNGVIGYVVRGRDDFADASIFLPCVGYGNGTSLEDADSGGYLWSSVPDEGNFDDAGLLGFISIGAHLPINRSRAYGSTIRPVWTGKPQGKLDECRAKMFAIHVNGWAYDPDVPSQSIGVHVYLYTDPRCTNQYGDVRILTADQPSPDMNQANGVEGNHGFDADITVDSGIYWVKVFAIDATNDGVTQIGKTRMVTTMRSKVQLWADGPYWAETNVGADEPLESGLYFWWGDTLGYRRKGNAWVTSDGSSSGFSFVEGNVPTWGKDNATLLSEGWITADGVLAPAHDAAQAHWGGDWRMPTYAELCQLGTNCDWRWTTIDGVNGYEVKGRGDYAFNSIFLPCAGKGNGVSIDNSYTHGYFWSSTPDDISHNDAKCLYNTTDEIQSRKYGFSVRPVLPSTAVIQTIMILDDCGGTGGTGSVTATYGSAMPAITVPTRPGYVFSGYYTQTNGRGTQYYDASGVSARNCDLTNITCLYAYWTGIQCAVTLDGQGGTGGTLSVMAVYGSAMPTISVPTRLGYIFDGYYTGTNGSGTQYYNASGASAQDWDLTSATTLYAHWTLSSAYGKIQLWADGPYWAEKNVGADEPWDYGYYFWWGDPVGYRRDRYAWVASDGSSSDFSFRSFDWRFFEKDFDTLQSEGWITADGVLAPEHDAAQIHWGGRWRMPTTQEMFSLSNNCDWTWTTTNGVSGYIVRGRGDYSAASIFLPAAGQADNTRLNWDGRYGGYWSSVPVASSYARLLEFETAIPGLNSNKDRGYGYPVRPVQVPTGSITISFNANGGSVSPSSGAYTPGETYGSLPPVTREGYTFAGWFTTATGGTQVVTTTIAPAVDITLYAHWVANQYTVTLDRQGGTYGTERVTATYDSAMPTIIVPRHPGHTFGGYYTGPNGNGTQYYTASGASVQNWNLTNATTLYAYWCDTHGKVQLWADGPYWAETNVGADEPWESGLYFWWGDTIGYRRENNAWVASDGSSFDFSFEARNVPTSGKDNATLLSEGWITSDGVLAPEYDAAQAYWSGRWRMPTEQELSDIYNNCDWTWTSTNGVKGYVVRGREDFADASIFIPAAGFGQKTYRYNVGSTGSFWASVPDKYDIENAEAIYFYSGYPSIFGYFRYNGYSVRPVQSAPTAYDIWAAANGVAGAWDATDANGVHNIFRYAFDKPTGTFTNPPLLSITFDGGQPIVLTPPLVNTNGYTFGLLAYDALTNANPSAFWLLSPDGTNAVPGNLPARFFRLGAAEGNIDDK